MGQLVAGAIFSEVGFGYYATTIIVNLAIAAIIGRILAPDLPKSGKGTKGLKATVRNPIAPRRIIYGEAVTGGPYIYLETGTANAVTDDVHNELLHMVVALSGHPVEDIIGVFIDNEYVDISGNTIGSGTSLDDNYYVTSGRFADEIAQGAVRIVKNNGWGFANNSYVTDWTQPWMQQDRLRANKIEEYSWGFKSGATGGTRDSGTGLWSKVGDHFDKAVNCSYIYLVLEYLPDVWSGIPNVKFHVKGKRLYNPALDPTLVAYGADSAGTHDLNDPDTWEYSSDWTLCVLDYLINREYGLAAKANTANPDDISLNEIDWAEAISSYAISSELITNALPTPYSEVEPRYTINGVLEVSSTPISIMENLLTAGAGELIYSQGLYKIRPGYYRQPESSLDIINEDMILSPITIQTHTPRSDLFNKVAGVYVQAYDRKYATFDPVDNIPIFESADFPLVNPLDSSGTNPYEISDGEEIIVDFDYPLTTSETMAQRLARIQLERIRRGLVVSFQASLEVLKYSVGDVIYLEILSNSKYLGEDAYNRLGLDSQVQNRPESPQTPYYKQFKILSMDYSEDFSINMTLIEESEVIYDWNEGDATVSDTTELVSGVPIDDPTGIVLPPSFVVNSPDQTITEVPSGTDIRTELKWSPADRGSVNNAIDRLHVQNYILEYGIIDNPSAVSPGARVSTWIPAPIFNVRDPSALVQGPIGLNNIFIDTDTSYDFRIRAVITDGRRSAWTYYSTDIGSDHTPTSPALANNYYIGLPNGWFLKSSLFTLTTEARHITVGGDNLLSSGTIQLYLDGVLLDVSNGFISPSDGYTGIVGWYDLGGGSALLELKDGPSGDVLDSVTLRDFSNDLIIVGDRDWLSPVATDMGEWSLIDGTLGNTNITTDIAGPFGEFPKVLTITGDDTAPGWYSLWKSTFAVQDNHSYLFYCWIKKLSADTTAGGYFGWEGNTVQTLGSPFTTAGNPYFIPANGIAGLTVGEWYLAVGILHPSDYTGADTGLAGIYRFTDATRVYDGTEYRVLAGVEETFIRMGFLDSSSPGKSSSDGISYTRPALYRIDGTEPSVQEYMRKANNDTIGANVITADNVNAEFYTGRIFTGGTFQTREPLSVLDSPLPDTARTSISEATQIQVQDSNDDVIFSVTDTGVGAEISIVGDFLAGSLDTAQMFSTVGLTDLRGRLGVVDPTNPTGGIATLDTVPKSIATASTDYELDVDVFNTALSENTFTFTLYDYARRVGTTDIPYTAPVWDVNLFYSVGSPHTWIAVPGGDFTLTGNTTNQEEPDQPIIYINTFTINATRTVDWTPASPFAADDPIYYMIRTELISGSSNSPKLNACNVSEAVVGGTGSGTGNVSNTGTPVDNQVAVWVDATTIEGTTGLTWDGSMLQVSDGTGYIEIGRNAGGWYELNGEDTLITYGMYMMEIGEVGLYDVAPTPPSSPPVASDNPSVSFSFFSPTNDDYLGWVGFDLDSALEVYSAIRGGLIGIQGTTTAGTELRIADFDPDTEQIIIPQNDSPTAPGYGLGDGDSGIYEPIDDTVSISTAGAERVSINATEAEFGVPVSIINGDPLTFYSTNSPIENIAINHGGTIAIFNASSGTDDYEFRFNGTTRFSLDEVDDRVKIHDGWGLRIQDSTDADYVDFRHNGASLIVTESNTDAIRFSGTTLDLDLNTNTLETAVFKEYNVTGTTATVTANAVTLVYSTSQAYELDLEAATGNVTVTISSSGTISGNLAEMVVKVQQDSTADRTLTWAGGTFIWGGDGVEVEPKTGSDAITIYYLQSWDAGTTWYITGVPYGT